MKRNRVLKVIVSNRTLLEEDGVLELDIDSANKSLYFFTSHFCEVWEMNVEP